jgi:hypothetical protein
MGCFDFSSSVDPPINPPRSDSSLASSSRSRCNGKLVSVAKLNGDSVNRKSLIFQILMRKFNVNKFVRTRFLFCSSRSFVPGIGGARGLELDEFLQGSGRSGLRLWCEYDSVERLAGRQRGWIGESSSPVLSRLHRVNHRP